MTDILKRILVIIERIRNMTEMSEALIFILAIIAAFGLVNCILGYRLLRFWMMLFGFVLGAGLGFIGVYTYGSGGKSLYAGVMIGAGVILALVAFLIYKVGVFVIGAGLGLVLSIYIIHPKTSAAFFVCILIGIGLGVAAMRWAREIIIVGTSLMGGVLLGVCAAKIAGLDQFPYGIGMSIVAALLGMLLQFAINKPEEDDEDEEEQEADTRRMKRRKEDFYEGPYNADYDLEYEYELYEEELKKELERERQRAIASKRRQESRVKKQEIKKRTQKKDQGKVQKKTQRKMPEDISQDFPKKTKPEREVDFVLNIEKALEQQLEKECNKELKVEEFNGRNT